MLTFDQASLADYLQSRLPGLNPGFELSQFQGGQSNPTYLIDDGLRKLVLRRKPPGQLLPSAHAIDREYRILTALQGSAVPVPCTYLYCNDASVIGSEFYVMEYLAGRTFWDPALPQLTRSERSAIFDDVNRIIAALHALDYAAVGLDDFGRPSNYMARQVDRWTKQYRATQTESISTMEELIVWLPNNVPLGEETSIVHGDFRLDNLIIHPNEPRVIGVLDWELSTLGHPLADFAYHMMAWSIPGSVWRGMAGANLAELGIPNQETYIRSYCQRTGHDQPLQHWDFYMAFNLFRIAAILQGVMHRALNGNAASNNARQEGARVGPLADIGWQFALHNLKENSPCQEAFQKSRY